MHPPPPPEKTNISGKHTFTAHSFTICMCCIKPWIMSNGWKWSFPNNSSEINGCQSMGHISKSWELCLFRENWKSVEWPACVEVCWLSRFFCWCLAVFACILDWSAHIMYGNFSRNDCSPVWMANNSSTQMGFSLEEEYFLLCQVLIAEMEIGLERSRKP